MAHLSYKKFETLNYALVLLSSYNQFLNYLSGVFKNAPGIFTLDEVFRY